MLTPSGAFAEYALTPTCSTIHVPSNITFEEASTVPLAAYTAAVAMHYDLGLPSPWGPPVRGDVPTPVLIYGASTAIGAFSIKLLAHTQVHPIIAVGSKTSSFITPLLNKERGDQFVDYTTFASKDDLAAELAEVLKRTGGKHFRAFDCVSTDGTYDMLAKALAPAAQQSPAAAAADTKPLLSVCLPSLDLSGVDPRVETTRTSVGRIHKPEDAGQLFAAVWATALEAGLSEGWLTPHPYEVVKGLEALGPALKDLREGRVRGKKMVVRVAEGN
jgi:NADPH2:quinone reductase